MNDLVFALLFAAIIIIEFLFSGFAKVFGFLWGRPDDPVEKK